MKKVRQHWKSGLFFLIFFITLIRIGIFIYSNGVNSYCSDEWEINEVFIHNPTIFSLLTTQYAAMFQGPSYVMTYLLALITNFDARVENWHTLAYLILGCLVIWKIIHAQRMTSIFDGIVPIAFFTILDYEILILDSAAPYGAFPIFILTIFCYINIRKWDVMRFFSNLILFIFLIYSGYGYVAVPGIAFYMLSEIFSLKERRMRQYAALDFAGLVLITIIFIQGFQMNMLEDASILGSSHASVIQYLAYSIHFVGFYAISSQPIPFLIQDIVVFFIVIGLLLFSVYLLIKRRLSISFLPFVLMSYTIGFIVVNSIGRISFGLEQVVASRYTIHFIPLIIGIYFCIKHIKYSYMRGVCFFLLALFLFFHEIIYGSQTYPYLFDFQNKKREIRQCVQGGTSLNECGSKLDFNILINGQIEESPKLENFVQYLKYHKANLYAK